MTLELGGLHHLTAITARAAENVDFYTRTLGMRLVKKTVNQDDVSAYHLFYGDEAGHAGTEVTFFGSNLLDREYINNGIDASDTLGRAIVFQGPPRRYGIEIAREF